MAVHIIVFGAAGQVGTDCVLALKHAGYDVLALTREELDFSQEGDVSQAVVACKPQVVINACAYTAVDKAEKETDIADQINHRSVVALAQACESVGALLIHLSTDYVFDGCAKTPYQESATTNPLGVYGHTKWAGEQAISRCMSQYVILRTSWVFLENLAITSSKPCCA